MALDRYGDSVSLNDEQLSLLEKLELPTSFEGLGDDEMIAIEDALTDELQAHGINDTGGGLNEYGELCRSVIVSLPDE